MPLLSVDGVGHGYGQAPVLENVSLAVNRGEIVSLLGPNGSGKTTLLKIMLGLIPPNQGLVRLDGVCVADMAPKRLARRLAYVPQLHRMSFAYRVLDVALMGRLPHKSMFYKYAKSDLRLAEAALEKLGIGHLKDRPYTDISGGERQLTLIARALTQGTDIFVMDEPVNGLDYGNQIRLLAQINDLAQEGYTFIKTTHFPDHALWLSDRVVMLKQGRVIADHSAARAVTDANLYELYGARINVVTMPGGGVICMPQAMRHTCRCQNLGPRIALSHAAAG
ncbi:ABC transporter [Desulfocarbo indianensis]|nr:ABC transporter [Desulfocarbo indianensis]